MSRKPFQVLVLPYHGVGVDFLYAVFQRKEGSYWQGIAGGGEGRETPIEAARREMFEEAAIPRDSELIPLDSLASVPVSAFPNHPWSADVLVIPEYSFGVEVRRKALNISDEHTAFRWVDYSTADRLLKWDSNRTALWELDRRLARQSEEERSSRPHGEATV